MVTETDRGEMTDLGEFEAAQYLGISRFKLRIMRQEGKIHGRDTSNGVRYTLTELDRVRQEGK